MEVTVNEELAVKEGLSKDEYRRIIELLGRTPNYTELGMFSAMWSEHCSYKTSKPVLKLFPTKGPRVLQGPGENAGVVDIGDGLAAVFKVESHNHPSAVEPYEASATGGGGCIRDIFTMGARPVCLLNSLRFGKIENDKVKFLFKEVARGFSDYCNAIGLPVIGGETYFDESYDGNPLVNAMTVGIVEADKIMRGTAAGVGNLVLAVGGPTGRDGVAGAAFASVALSEEAEEKKSAVAIGDPKMGKAVMEASLELMQKGYVVGMQDMGAAGLTCSTSETANRAGTGMEIDISLLPKREEGMTPYEVMLSESQERMLVIVNKNKLGDVQKILVKWKVPGVVFGKVTDDKMLRVKEGDKVVAEVPTGALVSNAPVYEKDAKEAEYVKETKNFDLSKIKEPEDYNETLLKILTHPSIASKRWLWEHGDPSTAKDVSVGPGEDAGVYKIPGTSKAIALTINGNGIYVYLNPYRGGAISVAEGARNLVSSGAEPLALTDGLNFGNPNNPEIFWQFKTCVEGMSEASRILNIPVISGNVSFNNENPKGSIDPTPVVGMVGLIENVKNVITTGFKNEGDLIILLGKNKDELGGSHYLNIVHNIKSGDTPEIDLGLERNVQKACLEAIRENLVHSAHDTSEGGLGVALAECAVSGGKGASISLLSDLRSDSLLFSESQSRIILTVSPEDLQKIEEIAKKHNAPFDIIGKVSGKRLLIKKGKKTLIDIDVKIMKDAYNLAIPKALGVAK